MSSSPHTLFIASMPSKTYGATTPSPTASVLAHGYLQHNVFAATGEPSLFHDGKWNQKSLFNYCRAHKPAMYFRCPRFNCLYEFIPRPQHQRQSVCHLHINIIAAPDRFGSRTTRTSMPEGTACAWSGLYHYVTRALQSSYLYATTRCSTDSSLAVSVDVSNRQLIVHEFGKGIVIHSRSVLLKVECQRNGCLQRLVYLSHPHLLQPNWSQLPGQRLKFPHFHVMSVTASNLLPYDIHKTHHRLTLRFEHWAPK